MKGDPRFGTYYAFLSLFTFSMLGLVLAENLLETYIFWELVGCSSYLLIGYYYDRPSAVAAAKKAFIVTRFADLGFLVGILVLSFNGGTLDFQTLLASHTAPLVGLILIFIGGAGKSAMFPLHVWLPDAMEGPTPVSALIHAATMVVAGVYLVARLFPLFALDVTAMQVVTYVGALSALLAATIACTQTDIKRILAYSTMSQIGYMMFALGVGGFTASMFHLFTHAFFKALLFLCAGIIIHQAHSNDMKSMGGYRRLMPLTHICFLIACLAIAGIPPFAGFFSKEQILSAALGANRLIYVVGVFTSGLTAFYMFRLYFSVFWGRPSHGHAAPAHSGAAHAAPTHSGPAHAAPTAVHRTPATEAIPLVILAIGAIFAGFVPFSHFVTADGMPATTHLELSSAILPVSVALAGILLAGLLYARPSGAPDKIAYAFGGFYRFVYHKFYIDEVYLFVTKKVIFPLVGRPAAWIDRNIVDGFMNALAGVTAMISGWIKGFQSGKLQDYVLYFFLGIAGLVVLFIYIYT